MSRHWVFIRGLGRHSGHWGPFVAEFRKWFPEDRIELMNLRGNGDLAHSPSLGSIADNVRDLRARSQFLRDEQPLHLLTISMGSMVGIEWAQQFPQEIEGVVAINTSDKGSSSFFERLRPANYEHFVSLLLRGATPLQIENDILKITTNLLPDRQHWAEIFAQTPATSRSNWLRQLCAASTYHFPEHKPRTEILLLASEKDRLVNPVCTKNIAEMWALKPHLHPSAGHDLPLDDGAWVCQEIQNWLQGQCTEPHGL
jgi:pimeloyl-ACP methyl ester carboxylesterase